MCIPAAAIVSLSVCIRPILQQSLHNANEASSSSHIYGPLSFVVSPINCRTSVIRKCLIFSTLTAIPCV
jgi:hypothetical protein